MTKMVNNMFGLFGKKISETLKKIVMAVLFSKNFCLTHGKFIKVSTEKRDNRHHPICKNSSMTDIIEF